MSPKRIDLWIIISKTSSVLGFIVQDSQQKNKLCRHTEETLTSLRLGGKCNFSLHQNNYSRLISEQSKLSCIKIRTSISWCSVYAQFRNVFILSWLRCGLRHCKQMLSRSIKWFFSLRYSVFRVRTEANYSHELVYFSKRYELSY